MVVGSWAGNYIPEDLFRTIMAVIIIASLVVMVWLELGGTDKIPDTIYFGAIAGFLGGFTSMIGNLAGTVMVVYFLSMKLPKNSFIGTAAWFFLVVNWFKVPFHVWVWHTINTDSWILALQLTPAIIIGALAGVLLVRKMTETVYRWFIVGMTLVAAVVMVLR